MNFFEDLALPNLIKTQLTGNSEWKTARAGYTSDGTPTNIRHCAFAARRTSAGASPGAPSLARLHEAEEELDELLERCDEDDPQRTAARNSSTARKASNIPFRTHRPADYNNQSARAQAHQPGGDVLHHGRVRPDGRSQKTSPRFFILLYLFCKRATTRSSWCSSATTPAPRRWTKKTFSPRESAARWCRRRWC